jgi:hypothetical protein
VVEGFLVEGEVWTERNGNDSELDNRRGPHADHAAKQTARCVETYTFIYEQYDLEFQFTLRDRSLWEELGSQDLLESYLKWKTANILASVWRQDELVPLPSCLTAFSHRFPTYGLTYRDNALFRNLIRSSRTSRKQQRFVFSLYQGKSGALAMREGLVEEKVRSACETLCTPPNIEESIFIFGKEITKEDVRAQLVRTVKEVYGPAKPTDRKTPREHCVPSAKSSFQRTRRDGGAFQHIIDDAPASFFISPPTLLGFATYHERSCAVYGTDPEVWEELIEEARRKSWKEEMDCYPVGLPEPFKVRVITKGESYHYHLARRWQKAMWTPLKDHPTFELIGKPLDQAVMNRFLGLCDTTDDREFTSGDYQSATDYLDSDLSAFCLEEVCNAIGVPFEDKMILRRALTDHILHWKNQDGEWVSKRQERGQLMGSPASFPILCLFNAALTRFALEIASMANPMVYALDEIPMLINGDDLLCRTSALEYLVWKDIVHFGGLTPSLGKNFRSRTIGTINSEMWHFSTATHTSTDGSQHTKFFTAEREQIIQMGMMRGSMKNGTVNLTQDEQSPFSNTYQWGASKEVCWRKFLDSCPKPGLAYDYLWKSISQQVIDVLPTGMPLCQPVWLGGAGFPLPPLDHPHRDRREPSASQRMIATYLADNASHGLGLRYLRALEYHTLPANLMAEMDADSEIRKKLKIPKPERCPRGEDVDDTPTKLPGVSPLPAASFIMTGCKTESSWKAAGSAEALYQLIFARSRRLTCKPLPCSSFRDSPPPLYPETYVFEGVVA